MQSAKPVKNGGGGVQKYYEAEALRWMGQDEWVKGSRGTVQKKKKILLHDVGRVTPSTLEEAVYCLRVWGDLSTILGVPSKEVVNGRTHN